MMTFIAVYWWVWLLGYIAVAGFGAVVFPRIEDLIEQEKWGTLKLINAVMIVGVCSVPLLVVSVITNIVFALS